MAQHDYVISNQSGSAFRADLNNALSAIVSQNSGSSEPSTTYAYMLWADTTNGKLKLRNGSNNAWVELGDLTSAGLGILTNVPLGTVSAPGIAFAGDPNTGIYSPTTDQIAITTGGVQRLNITTAALLPTLPIRGADGTAANPAFSFSGDTDTGIYRIGANQLGIATNGALQVTVDSSGNLGLGGTPSAFASSTKALQVRNYIFEDNSNGYGIIRYNGFYNGTNDVYISNGFATAYQTLNGQHRWFTAPSGTAGNAISFTQAMTLDSSGNLLVGWTTVPGNWRSSFYTNTAGAWPLSVRGNDRGTVFRLGASTGFATYFETSDGASVAGSISLSGTTASYNTSSDYRLKEQVQPMTGALAKVAALKPVTYKWKADGSDGEGFIAHELQEVVPQAVTGEKDAVEIVEVKDEDGNVIGTEERPVYQGIDTSFLAGLYAAAIQELKAEVDAMTARIAALEAA